MEQLMKKVKRLKETGQIDLSLEEDLSIGVMNLISLEEHAFFTAKKTNKPECLGMLNEIREVRKKLLGRLISTHEGETWCMSKHLLAATMRCIEVGTKFSSQGRDADASELFDTAYRLYSFFWTLRLQLLDAPGVPQSSSSDDHASTSKWTAEDIMNKLVDCCKE